ncbi:glucagon-like peptide 2 receptor [Latimeria chalumnae]|uniref:glucagon-like peptide 2 receptor n=1 Tax=Latimeria chalumnae TaxID=7897 RepID=UPI00313D46C2
MIEDKNDMKAKGASLEDTIRMWFEYKEQCLNTITSESVYRTGVYCNGTFDQFVCWPDSPPGNVSVPCPWYLPWVKKGSTGRVYRVCSHKGLWDTVQNSTQVWRDHSECSQHNQYFNQTEQEHLLLTVIRFLYTVGYSLSLASLLLAVLILLLMRKLHCTRNYIHINLFCSFILRVIAVFVKDSILDHTYSKRPNNEMGWTSYFKSQLSMACRATHILMNYFVVANHYWLLVEGIYLHTLLVTVVLSEKRLLQRYILIGWVFPVLFVVPWIITKALYENKGCWGTNINMGIWWIIRGPVMLSLAVNFYIFIKILKLLLSKLKARQLRFSDYKHRLARSTLVLISVFGIQEVVFAFVTDDQVEGLSRIIRLFIQLPLSSFQGFLVALLYCFANGEVQTELKKRWKLLFLANHFDCTDCIFSKPFKYLGKYLKQRRNRYFDGKGFHSKSKRPSSVQLLQVTVKVISDFQSPQPIPLEYFARESLSESSNWDITLGETLEESQI